MPIIEVFSGDACKVFAIGDDVAGGVQQLVEFPVGSPSVKKFTSFAEMPTIGSCLFTSAVQLGELGLEFSAMPPMEEFPQVLNFTCQMQWKQ